MATKKNSSRADEVVSSAKKSSSNGKAPQKRTSSKQPLESGSKRASSVKTEYERGVPNTAATAFICLGGFLLFFVYRSHRRCGYPDLYFHRSV